MSDSKYLRRGASRAWCACCLLAVSCGGKLVVDSEGIHDAGRGAGGMSSGGTAESGGVQATGGIASNGGALIAGGTAGVGGSATGGQMGLGGTSAAGGAPATGSVTAAGGNAQGGAGTDSGGTSGDTGGATSAGGVGGATGGAASSGGVGGSTTASGGAIGTGGGGFADAGHCFDGKRDSTESDVDCGGECAGCGPGQVCYFDSDCSATAVGCDQCFCDAFTATCVYSHCFDHRKDADETDFDCGGSKCHPCATGKACLVDADCTSTGCDSLTFLCDSNTCSDHHQDNYETDVDCGGGGCKACWVGQKCLVNFDCQSGHVCNAAKVCE